MKRRTLLFVTLACSARAQLARPDVIAEGQELRGHFAQERRLQGFSRPLRSSGSFLLLPGRGLLWRGEVPFATTLVITAAGILQMQDGEEAMRLPASRAPGIGRFYDVLGGALSGDPARLEQVFIVAHAATTEGWQLTLTPKSVQDPALAQVTTIELRGSRLIEAVSIRKANGDEDRLLFTAQRVAPAAPSAEEAALLARL